MQPIDAGIPVACRRDKWDYRRRSFKIEMIARRSLGCGDDEGIVAGDRLLDAGLTFLNSGNLTEWHEGRGIFEDVR